MLLWQQLRLSRKKKFLTKLFFYSSVFHACLCFVLFFVYARYSSRPVIQVSSTGADVIVKLIPFAQKAPKQSVAKTATRFVKNAPKKVAPKAQPKKVLKHIPNKNIKPFKNKDIKKAAPNKKPIAQKQPVQKPVEKKEQDIKYVTRKEFDAVLVEQALQDAIAQVWAPPAGMEETLVCEVALTVGWNGELVATSVEHSSGVVVYDIAVEQAIEQLKFPRQTWGKTVRVAFKP